MTSTSAGWNGNVLGVVQNGVIVDTFGTNFIRGSSQSYELKLLPNV